MKRRHKFKSCENCGFQFDETNEFCPSCGQENHTHKLPFRYFLLEYLGSIYNFDTKVLRTLKGMFVNPGETIALFNQNKRARFVPPVRMFLFSSFLLFLMIGLFGAKGDSIKPVNNDSVAKNNLDSIKTLKSGTEEDSVSLSAGMVRTRGTIIMPESLDTIKSFTLTIEDKKYLFIKDKTNPFVWNALLKIMKSYRNKSQKEIGQVFYSNLNGTLILLLPVTSLLMFLLYWRKRLFYSEFFIFSLFFQSQICFIISLLIVLSSIAGDFLAGLVFLTMPIYLVLTLKRVYQQSWAKTIIKAFLFGGIMVLIGIIVSLINLVYSLYTA